MEQTIVIPPIAMEQTMQMRRITDLDRTVEIRPVTVPRAAPRAAPPRTAPHRTAAPRAALPRTAPRRAAVSRPRGLARLWGVIVAACAAVGLIAGCASVVGGNGSLASDALVPATSAPAGSAASAVPMPSQPVGPPTAAQMPTGASTPAAPVLASGCPHVVYADAGMSFDCVTGGMTQGDDGFWPVTLVKTVEPSTGWSVDEGAGDWGDPGGQTLSEIASYIRDQMTSQYYGDAPTVTTVADEAATVNGVKAHLLQSTITINADWASQQGTQVKQERLWIVVLQAGTGDVVAWYVSVPDLVSNLWPKVPALIKTIKTD